MVIYLKCLKKVSISGCDSILLRDIGEIFSSDGKTKEIYDIILVKIDRNKKGIYLISVVDVISAIRKTFPQAEVNSVGEAEVVLEYKPEQDKGNKFVEYAKVVFISFVLFCGSAVAIMTFQTEAQITMIFKNIYKIFLDKQTNNPWLLSIPYCFGIFVGIICFYNHLGTKKITEDPTPIEVEMATYEGDVTDTVKDILSSERESKRDNDNN